MIVGVTIPLYDSGLRSAMLAQARNAADSASTRLARSREEAVRQIVTAQNTLQTTLTAHAAAKELLAAAALALMTGSVDSIPAQSNG